MDKYIELAELIFPDVKETIADLEKRYPARNLKEGAMVTRFAPSPTGFLHTGSLFTAFICQKFATQSNGVFYIRLEDTDQKREIKGAGEALLKELKAFNVYPTEGYLSDTLEEGIYGPYVQSKRADIYKVVIKELIKRGQAYPCFCSSEELASLREVQEATKVRTGYYKEYAKCRYLKPEEAMEKIKNGDSFVIRFKSNGDEKNKIAVFDEIRGHLELSENDQDIVIYKSDGLPTYHFAHLVDDHFMHTTHVIRGEEWLPSLPIHLQLFNTLGFEAPKYAHLPVIMKVENGNRRKLSKRKDDEAAVSFFLKQGYPTDGFLEYLLTIANSNYEEWRSENLDKSLYDFILTFSKMSLDGALFDLDKVKNICKELLSRLTKEEITDRALAWANVYDKELEEVILSDRNYFEAIMNIERGGEKPRKDYTKYDEILPAISFMYDKYYNEATRESFNERISNESAKEVLTKYLEVMDLTKDEVNWFNDLKSVGVICGYAENNKEYKKNKDAYKGHVGDVAEILRVAIAKRRQTPNLYHLLKILGKEKVKARILETISVL
ncbi:MAG: glutamate--tRNA ligase [Bacilli bacterium]|nr:glutamate--tRNA ligase [Bacilli bacterium]